MQTQNLPLQSLALCHCSPTENGVQNLRVMPQEVTNNEFQFSEIRIFLCGASAPLILEIEKM
jgi:hypothetical protein